MTNPPQQSLAEMISWLRRLQKRATKPGPRSVDYYDYTNALRGAAPALFAAAERADQLAARVEELREALAPFADFIGRVDEQRLPADMPLTLGSPLARRQVTVADFRRAGAVYAETHQGGRA